MNTCDDSENVLTHSIRLCLLVRLQVFDSSMQRGNVQNEETLNTNKHCILCTIHEQKLKIVTTGNHCYSIFLLLFL